MKKSKVSLLVLILAFALLLSACGEYTAAVTKPSNQPVLPTDSHGQVDENPFTVTLTFEGKPFPMTVPIDVIWDDGYSLFTAPVGTDSVARAGGLDGDYRVTLSQIPDGYTYNPNAYIATNNSRNIEIELYKLIPYTGKGVDLYKDCIQINQTGVYCITVDRPDQEVFFEFRPTKNGDYCVESWMDTIDDEINPTVDYYGASFAFKPFSGTFDDGGAAGNYTKNFKLNVQIADENISSGGSGAVAFTFAVRASHKNDEYPIKVYFVISRDGGFDLYHPPFNIITPTQIMSEDEWRSGIHNYGSDYVFKYPETRENGGVISNNVFDGSRYKLWPKTEGGDDYYHVYDLAKYPNTKGYGPILYADISSPCRFIESPFTTIEYAGNSALTVENGTENHKLFIEGWSYLNYTNMTYPGEPNTKPPYFCNLLCPCRVNETCDSIELVGVNGTCLPGCETCLPTCNQCPAEAIGSPGYGGRCNDDGRHPVTEELKEFLQKFSTSQMLFMDGNGFVETHPQHQIYASEEDQWLFACGYYEKK